ncbi:MAG TPA: phosphatase PAP2 family protein [Solimonas sp.]|nr:phosphatase PAP2 family protein [Solimonas sp.]
MPTGQRPWKEALLWLLLLAPGFLAVYGGANLYTAQLAPEKIGEIGMAWEQAIPFWPWTILPYFSIDLLYLISPFVCLTRQELRTHVLRFVLVTVISAGCFVLFPLRFGHARPEVDGIPGLLFDVLSHVDQPFNQAPSLHIGLLVVLGSCYRRHCPPRWRWLLYLVLTSIACSVLTTWQHHFLDVPTGLAVGIVVCWLIQPSSEFAAHRNRDRHLLLR